VLIPGFYKNVKAPSKDELKAWKRLPFNEEKYRKAEVGSKVLTGEPGYSVLYRTWARLRLRYMGCRAGLWRWSEDGDSGEGVGRRFPCVWCRTRTRRTS